MGDEEFSKEELEILGESEEESGQDTQDTSEDKGESQEEESKTEQTTETEEAETEETEQEEEEEKENMVPQSRVDQIVREREEEKRKNDLLRRDPQAYYEKYPDEKPEEKETETAQTTFADVAHMRVQGGTYNGKTLQEVYDADPFTAMAIYNDYRDEQRETQRKTVETQERLKRESEQEVNTFTEKMAHEMFGKEKDNLESKETKQLDTFIDGILNWMEETGRANTMADAYILMNHEEILKAAQVKSTKALIDGLSKGTVKSATTQKSDEEKTGYGRFMEYSEQQLADHIDSLSDAEMDNFIKNAPAKLKEKHPKAFAAWD